MNNTYIQKQIQQPTWYLIDAKSKNLGRLSTFISVLLKGKNKVKYTLHVNPKIHIIIINAQYIHVTGQKKSQKVYKRHSGKPGKLKQETFEHLNKRIPNRIIEHSVKGMLPKNSLGRQLFRQLYIYPDTQHPHIAQKPKIITFT
uniref:Large ribosomal subunit protein uL13c n=2 Tax=Kappaphycus TaxID=38543 RepID=A0A2H4FQ94_9FLOR|nr:50S ribosomal protein L13 [Kappaphycus striatus]